MKLTGRVVFRDLEGGVWVLEGDDGQTYQLLGAEPSIQKDGQRVEVDGKVDPDVLTFAMMGPVLRVTGYRFI